MPPRFQHRPDILDLVIDPSAITSLPVRTFGTGMGQEPNGCAFYKESYLGVLISECRYFTNLGINTEGAVIINLAPAVPRHPIDPAVSCTAEEFERSLRSLLAITKEWTLICEKDCDQEPVPRLQADQSVARDSLEELFGFLNGTQPYCPTFIIDQTA